MKLRMYQEEAAAQICEAMRTSHKLKVQISIGLGRFAIIASVLHSCVNENLKVLVLTPNRRTCYQLRDLFLESGHENDTGIALYIKEYAEHHILITTYEDLKESEAFKANHFNIVICDGVHFLDGEIIERKFNEKDTCFIGFTSQVNINSHGWFYDAKCIFRYTIQDAIQDGYVIKGYEFETIVFNLFKEQGYSVEVVTESRNIGYDLRADKGEIRYAIEAKLWDSASISDSVLRKTAKQLIDAAKQENRIPMLVIANPSPQKIKERLSEHKDLVIIDIQNLLFMVQGNLKIEESLIAILGYSLGDLSPIKPEIEWNDVKREELNIYQLIDTVKHWEVKEKNDKEYEELCYKVLRALFADDLTLWKTQERANDGLFRFDLICKIKNGNIKDFWRIAETYFKSKYIVFEFKNYTEQIKQNEIFTTEKYLYLKALRGVAIIISANGEDKNAGKAIRGILREDGKLIVSLSNDDIIEMLRKKNNHEDPADYLSDKLDELLIALEK